jgi:signal transduction histidine kinase
MYQIGSLRREASSEQEKPLDNIKLNVQSVIQELRSIAKELRPPTIGNFGLEKAIRSHMEDFQEKHPQITVHLDLAHDRQLLPENVRLALFRIYQQSLTNVVRHAEATKVHVRFTMDAEETRLKIFDNGKGFDARNNWAELARQGHFGLAGAAERVSALGGVFTVESQPQKGTTILVVIPFQESPES